MKQLPHHQLHQQQQQQLAVQQPHLLQLEGLTLQKMATLQTLWA
jgi:hypothetical protein